MKKYSKIPLEFQTEMSGDALDEKISAQIAEQETILLSEHKGREMILWEKTSDNYIVKLYHAYGNDMCDTMFKGKIQRGQSGCLLSGEIRKPSGVWGIFWLVIALATIVGGVTFLLLALTENLSQGIVMIYPAALIVLGFVELSLLKFDEKRLSRLNNYLREFTEATNDDILEDD